MSGGGQRGEDTQFYVQHRQVRERNREVEEPRIFQHGPGHGMYGGRQRGAGVQSPDAPAQAVSPQLVKRNEAAGGLMKVRVTRERLGKGAAENRPDGVAGDFKEGLLLDGRELHERT
jgi:hypothetical protein